MAPESVSIESPNLEKSMALPWQGGGLKWKLTATFSALILLLGLLVIGIVYYFASSAMQKQIDLRSTAIATNLSDAAAGHVSRRNTLELDALISKYGRLDGVAYAYIQDPKGELLATSLQPFPSELKAPASIEKQRGSSSRITQVRGKPVYETQVVILDGQMGTVHIGLWADTVQRDVRATVLPIVGLIAICLLIGIVVSVVLAGKTIRPILELKSIADDISRGHLDIPVSIQSNDEVGELARSLERMRASLKAAMRRLNKE
jgi:HAMP domain-containing protein